MKKIGLAGNLAFMESGMFPGYAKSYVNDDYVASVAAAGAVPVILPVVDNEEIVHEQMNGIDALVITGGWDVDPSLWGDEPHTKLGPTLPARDSFDYMVLKEAKERHLPVFGICRGIQIMNVFAGGTLWQDISEQARSFVRHWQGSHPAQATHTITTAENSRLHRVLGEAHRVNSFHHMAVHQVAPGFRATAWAADGTIEGIEATDGSPVFAVQWHPEMLHRVDEAMLNLFRELL